MASSFRYLAVDVETLGLDLSHGIEPFIITATDDNLKEYAWEFPVNPKTRKVKYSLASLKEVQKLLKAKELVFHNGSFDIKALANAGIYLSIPSWRDGCQPINFTKTERVLPVTVASIDDTLNASHICFSDEQHGLKYLAAKYLDIPNTDEKDLQKAVVSARAIGKRKEWKLGEDLSGKANTKYDYWMPKAINPKCKLALTYGKLDTKRTILLWLLFKELLEKEPSLLKSYQEEMDLMPELYAMESTGITLHKKRTSTLLQKMQAERKPALSIAEKIGKRIHNPEFNCNSPIQVSQLLFGWSKHGTKVTQFDKSFKLPVYHYTDTKAPSTNADTLDNLLKHCQKRPKTNKVALQFLTSIKTAAKYETGCNYLQSYINHSLPDINKKLIRLYPSFNQTGTRLTRLSSSNPNGQNITENPEIPLRSVFCPAPDKVWYSIDGSQLELAILAYASQDQRMLQAIEDKEDFHDMVMRELFYKESKQGGDAGKTAARKKAKAVNFRITYGGDGAAIDAIGGPGTYKRFAARFPGLPSYMAKMIAYAKKNGFVETLSGRRLYVDPRRAKTKAVNAVVQGTAGEWAKFAMRRVSTRKLVDWKKSFILLQLHDELLLEYPKTTPLVIIRRVCNEMKAAAVDLNFKVNVDVKIIKSNWAEKESVVL
jgi:DNA polymerase I-like protein with 3'-5' exonuclease and polymerase domains